MVPADRHVLPAGFIEYSIIDFSFGLQVFEQQENNKKDRLQLVAETDSYRLVGVRGLEPPASWSRTKRSTT